jgi:hypothetical protein
MERDSGFSDMRPSEAVDMFEGWRAAKSALLCRLYFERFKLGFTGYISSASVDELIIASRDKASYMTLKLGSGVQFSYNDNLAFPEQAKLYKCNVVVHCGDRDAVVFSELKTQEDT